ncbi:MAG: hypothetical protein COB85_00850 [Bacteroidetes bacterium]|nr:MAG: hypothetical protein COB85_00850 [Bacteroidota bacterium]
MNIALGGIAVLGILDGLWLYIWDKKYNRGRLNTVEKNERITDIITSPGPDHIQVPISENL